MIKVAGCPTHGHKHIKRLFNKYVCCYEYSSSSGEHSCLYELTEAEKNNYIQYQSEQGMEERKQKEIVKREHKKLMEIPKLSGDVIGLMDEVREYSWLSIKSYFTEELADIDKVKIALLVLQVLVKERQNDLQQKALEIKVR